MGVDDPPPAYGSIVRDICAQPDELRQGKMLPGGRNVSEQERRSPATATSLS